MLSPHQNSKEPGSARDRESKAAITVEMAAAGNPGAFEQLVTINYNRIFKMVYYRIRSSMDAEDLTQDIFMKVYKKIGSLKDYSSFNSWLFSIAVNKVRDYQRKKRFTSLFGVFEDRNTERKEEDTNEPASETGQLESVIRQNFWKQLDAVLCRLSYLEKEVFQLRFLDNLGIREISDALGKNESTVKTHLYRALKKVREDASLRELLKESVF